MCVCVCARARIYIYYNITGKSRPRKRRYRGGEEEEGNTSLEAAFKPASVSSFLFLDTSLCHKYPVLKYFT